MSYGNKISNAKTHADINEIVEDAAMEFNVVLDDSMTYQEQAAFLASEGENLKNHDDAETLFKMSAILVAAESRWFALNG